MCSRCNLCPISNLYFPAIGEVQQETNKGIVSNFSQMKCWLGDSDKRYLAREIKLLIPLTLPILNLESSYKEGEMLFVVVICLLCLLLTQVLFSFKPLLQKNKRPTKQIKVFLWYNWKKNPLNPLSVAQIDFRCSENWFNKLCRLWFAYLRG